MFRYQRLLPIVLLVCVPAWAHRLVPNDGTHVNAASALHVADLGLSQLFLQEISPQQPQFWVSFQCKAGDSIYFQLGIPDIVENAEYRPAVALLAPGFPAAEGLPFEVPEDYGAMVFDSVDAVPTAFDEPFTGTRSLILFEETLTSQTDGVYFLVLYHPHAMTGKAWVALGQREAFGLGDLIGFADTVETVRTFHEVNDQPMPFLTRVLVKVSGILVRVLSWLGQWGILV